MWGVLWPDAFETVRWSWKGDELFAEVGELDADVRAGAGQLRAAEFGVKNRVADGLPDVLGHIGAIAIVVGVDEHDGVAVLVSLLVDGVGAR